MPFNQKKQKRVDRTDKWYVLAKEQGYRSRAAFKLSHINKEFNLISKQTRVVLDLCAAPGGWSQVAAKEAGAGCAVIAVDLLPIRPIPNVRTIVGDITLDRTHAIVRKEAKESMQRQDDEEGRAGRYVDVVLCDGAPNVGATLGDPRPITFAACHHAIASRREHKLPRPTLNEQPRCQQPETA